MKKFLPYILLPICVVILSRNNPFFWDTTYHSILGQWFYENGTHGFILPLELDAGHPPFFGYYLSCIWKLFGKTLTVSHLAILPFALGIYWQMFRLIHRYIPKEYAELTALFIAFEPTLLAQCSLVSYELVYVFFYLLGLNAIIRKQKIIISLSLIGLILISSRGLFAIGALFITQLIIDYKENKTSGNPKIVKFANFIPFIFPIALGIGWYSYHYMQSSWWFLSPSEAYHGQRKILGLGGILRNVVIIIWRCLDFGRIGLWILLLISIYRTYIKKIYLDNNFQRLLIYCSVPLIVFSLAFIPFSNPIGHRYYLVFYLLFVPFVIYSFTSAYQGKLKYILISAVGVLLLSGHFWLYPPGIAMGWDSTLAHIPYFELRKAMINHIKKENIPFNTIGTVFPNKNTLKETDLVADTNRFSNLNLKKNQYVLQSNIMNDFSDAELNELNEKWILVQEYKKSGIYMRLYHKR